MDLGYVGLGAMGGALARRLMLSHKLRGLDLRPDTVAEFSKEGAVPAQDGASLARESDVAMQLFLVWKSLVVLQCYIITIL